MQSPAEKYLQSLKQNNSLLRTLRQSLMILSFTVVMCVFWGLKLTGITMAGEAFCGIPEHIHGEECPLQTLICQQEESEAHMHTEECILRTLICDLEEREPHTHTDECKAKTLICTLPESEGHTHDETCIGTELICPLPEEEPHVHGDGCYTKTLICTEPEVPAHSHCDGCYTSVPTCGREETTPHVHGSECTVTTKTCTLEESQGHTHSDSCRTTSITCGLEESETHTHDASCMTTTLTCTIAETPGHRHGDGCYTTEVVCTYEEPENAHTHSASCMTTTLTCTMAETAGHVHEDACYEIQLTCTKAETEGHTHTEECYQALPDYICGLEEHEPHTHGTECYLYEEGVYICELEETEGHLHGDACYLFGVGFGCGLTEAEGHVHTIECITPETEFGCEKEISQGHTHTEDCYDTHEVCPLEEHIHDETCYSDLQADLETSDDWEMTLMNLTRSHSTAKNVLSVAQSQLGYTESIRNFEVDAHLVRRGITRYGQWYGNPYGDWSAMFTSFCVYYAGVDAPCNAGPEAMRLEWEEAELYVPYQEFAPHVGFVLFLDKDLNGTADATAIIESYDDTTIYLIEGNVPVVSETTAEDGEIAETVRDTVARTEVPLDDPILLGYGLIPDDSILMVLPARETNIIAAAKPYANNMFSSSAVYVVYTTSGASHYAIDGTGSAVPIYIDDEGNIASDLEDPTTLFWTVSGSNTSYKLQNVSTGRYLYPENNTNATSNNSGNVTFQTAANQTGVRIRSGSRNSYRYPYLDTGSSSYAATTTQNSGSFFQFGARETFTIWLDGSCGGVGYLSDSPNEHYSVAQGEAFRLPETWTSPSKYQYRLRGWYDITNSKYYIPGQEITVTENTVLYADWVAATYDIGRFDANVADTVSTSSFMTTYMFDYNYLFNIQSAQASKTVSSTSHSETWSMVTSGNVEHNGQQTFDFVFTDNDGSGRLTMPNNRDGDNTWPGEGIITQGIYSSDLANLLFSTSNIYNPETGEGILGKTYLGTGDHLFQIMTDPNDPHYGYYYYDSLRNAASYNQSNGRFYVYDYLEGTRDSSGGNNADFLPLNSHYANTNGKNVPTYTHNGQTGYRYDAKFSDSSTNVSTDYAYGMKMNIKFYLPQDTGNGGNKDINGNDMVFEFSGDDDLWILVDGKLVLDLGGIHTDVPGTINFSNGTVNANGIEGTFSVPAGDHTMTVLYLERGSSMSNCSIYFNLAPRFSLQLKKEDVLTQQLLDGTEFSIFEDFACTKPALLWESEAAYNRGTASKNTFVVENGMINIWGLGSGNTYYLKETGAPNVEGYGIAQGLIRLTIVKEGMATYHVDVIPDAEGNEPSNGFTVHDIRIDDNSKTMYITATNAPESVIETTTVQVMKKWEDNVSHSGDYITAYLTVTDPDGTVRRIREILLSDENGWNYIWTNLPKYDYGQLAEVTYGIEESYESGYYSTVRRITQIVIETADWAEAGSFENGESYILKYGSTGYLSTTSTNESKLTWVTESTAKSSSLAQWTATVSGGKVKFTNGSGQIITYNTGGRYFTVQTSSNSNQSFTPVEAGSGFRFYITSSWQNRYFSTLNSTNGRLNSTTTANSGIILTPYTKITQTDIQDVEDWGYQITNTPLPESNETSMSVEKVWEIPENFDETLYQEFQVTVQLLANGVNTGRSITLSLKNGWKGAFLGLPYADANGNVITYTVKEVWSRKNWVTIYGEITTSGSNPPTYSTTITNQYHPGGPQLPSTGTSARLAYILCGGGIMLVSLVYGIGLRRRKERRQN